MKKIRLVFEAEVDQSTEITMDIMRRAWGSFSTQKLEESKEWQEQVEDEKVLLQALLANPAVYKEFLLSHLMSAVETMGLDKYEEILGHHPINYYELEKLVPSLPFEASARFKEAIENGGFSESTYLVNSSIEATITSVRVEEID